MALVDNAFYVDYGNGSTTGYYSVAVWSNHTAVAGELIRQATTPAVNSERCFVCTTGGATGAVEPTWTVTRGALNTSSSAVYQEATGLSGLNGDLTNTPNWAAVKAAAPATLGQIIVGSASGTQCYFMCTVGGTMGAAEPTWPSYTTAGATVTETSAVAVWTNVGPVTNFTGWQAPHARIRNAHTSTWVAAGNKVFVASEHAETQTSNMSITFTGGTFTYCTAKTPVPPTASTTGATVSTTTTGTMGINGTASTFSYVDGIDFNYGDGANSVALTLATGTQIYVNCSFNYGATGTGNIFLSNGDKYVWLNTKISFGSGAVASCIKPNGNAVFEWKRTASALSTGTVPTTLFLANGGSTTFLLEGVDLSALVTGKNFTSSGLNLNWRFLLKDCKIGSGATICASVAIPQAYVTSVRTDSAGTNYIEQQVTYYGTLVDETTIYRSGGATDGTTPISKNILTTANSKWQYPYELPARMIWNDTTGTNRVVTMYGIWKGATVPNNDDCWMDVEYLGDAASPLGSFNLGTKASGLASNSAQTADSTSDWTGGTSAYVTSNAYGAFTGAIKAGNASPQQIWFMVSHSGTGTSGSDPTIFNGKSDGAQVTDNAGANQIVWQAFTRFKMTTTLSAPQPAQKGPLTAYLKFATASTRFYVDPLPVLS